MAKTSQELFNERCDAIEQATRRHDDDGYRHRCMELGAFAWALRTHVTVHPSASAAQASDALQRVA